MSKKLNIVLLPKAHTSILYHIATILNIEQKPLQTLPWTYSVDTCSTILR